MTGFATATARFMASYGCRLEEELLFLLGCPLFLSARWSEAGSGPRFETENPCRYEYLASAFGSPYQLRTIDGPDGLAWVTRRIERREPLLLDLAEASLREGADAESGRRVCAFVSCEGDEIELASGPRLWVLTLRELAAALLRRGDARAVMFYAPLQPLPEGYLREVVRQSLVKQHNLLRACPYGESEVGLATLLASLYEGAGDPAAVERHRRLLASLRPASPASDRAYYAHALRTAAPRCGTVLRGAADAFSENTSAWSAIAARAVMDDLSAEEIGDLYEAMWKAETTLVHSLSPMVAEVCA